jgi:hypothetical protein
MQHKFSDIKSLKIALLIILISFPLISFDDYNFCNTSNLAFQVGEKAQYRAYYNLNFIWLPAGDCTFTLEDSEQNGRSAYHITAFGRTLNSYEWFYKVRDTYETYIDKETMLPLRFKRNVNEGGYLIYNDIIFDQSNKKAKAKFGKTAETAEYKEFDMNGCMHDVLSIIYFTRNLDFDNYSIGQKIPISIFLDNENYKLHVKYLGKEKKKIKELGNFNVIKFSPLLVKGNMFKDVEKMIVYVSDDKNRVPLMIESPVSVGSVKIVLKKTENLRHPFVAKIE